MEWYYLRDGKTMGPVPEGSIRAWLESGFLHPDDLLWRAGMGGWLPAADLPEFGGGDGSGADESGAPAWSTAASEPGAEPGSQPDALSQSDAAPADQSPAGESTAPTGSYPGNPAGPGAPASASPWDRARIQALETPAAYANIWSRAGAAAIDLMLLVSLVLVVFRPELPTGGNIEEMSKLNPAITPVFMALAWLYFGLMEGSVLQGSIGKLAFGLKVTDLEGNRLPPGRALSRGLLKVVLMEITAFLSFLPAAFTPRRQALHDLVAGSTVLLR
jgi:uncharacterized RDD family membrane protein YckC